MNVGPSKVYVYCYNRLLQLISISLLAPSMLFSQYQLKIIPVDKDSISIHQTIGIPSNFKSRVLCQNYINKLPSVLQSKGYPTASIDSVVYDSMYATVHLYVGENFRWTYLETDSADKRLLDIAGWNDRLYQKKPLIIGEFQIAQRKILEYLENNGYPFARVELDSVRFMHEELYAKLVIDKGPLYKIDSIRNYGDAKISNVFLQRYLGIINGSIYRKERLQAISTKLLELPYVQEKQQWNLTLLGTGSVLNVYLAPKKSSQVNVLIGLLPANQQLGNNKMLVTGEANINLRNALGNGETIGLNWQQIQIKSPRLNILFQQPYLFGSPFGVNFNFDLFKKDSSFVNISLLLGAQYSVSSNQTGSIFIQSLSTNLLNVDTVFVKNNRRLPDEADISSVNVGINYELFGTDYRFNPRKGNELWINTSVGIKNIKKNNVIGKLSDSFDPSFDFNSLYDTIQLKSYQFRIKVSAAHYFPLTRVSTIKTAINGGWFQSPSIFRNELFQIGGYKILRGFDEESIFASRYAVATGEYRYFLGQNSYLYSFVDFGWAQNNIQNKNISNSFLGAGIGMAFETKAGIFNISYAAGKRNDTRFNLRQSKIHLGYVNYF